MRFGGVEVQIKTDRNSRSRSASWRDRVLTLAARSSHLHLRSEAAGGGTQPAKQVN